MASTNTAYRSVTELVGDIIRLRVPVPGPGKTAEVRLNDLATLRQDDIVRLAQVIDIRDDLVSLQVFDGCKGISTDAEVFFLGHPMEVTFSDNILGRVFDGKGNPTKSRRNTEYLVVENHGGNACGALTGANGARRPDQRLSGDRLCGLV